MFRLKVMDEVQHDTFSAWQSAVTTQLLLSVWVSKNYQVMAISLPQQLLIQVTATRICSTLDFHSVWYFCYYGEKSAFVLKTLKLSFSTCCANLFFFLPLVFRSRLLMPLTPQVGRKLPAEQWSPGILVVFISVQQQLILSNTLLLEKENLQAFPTSYLADLPTLLGFFWTITHCLHQLHVLL